MVGSGGRKSHRTSVENSLRAYSLAVLSVVIVWMARMYVEPVLGGASPLLPFTFSVTVAAYFGGWRPGMAAALFGALAGGSFFRGAPLRAANVLSLAMFLLVSVVISYVFERLRRERKRAAESEERFRLLVEGASLTAFFAVDTEGRVDSWNAGAERVTGYPSEMALGRKIDFLYGEAAGQLATARSALDAAVKTGSFTWEGLLTRRTGERFWAEVSTTALRSADGALRGFSQVTRDLTEAKRHEMALSESEEAMRGLMESAAQGIVAVNREGTIVLVNAMSEHLFGYSRQDLLGSPIEMLLPARLAQTHVKQREAYFSAPRNRTMGMGLPLSAIRKDGTEFPVEISLSTVQTRQGQLAVSFITDITSRRAAERERENLTREIVEERARLRAVLDQMPVGVILAESPGAAVVLHNREAERLLKHQISGPSADNSFGGEDENGRRLEASEYPLIRALVKGETVKQEEMRYRRGDNETTVLSVSASPIRDSQGQIVASVTTFTDISARKQAELERELLLAEMRTLNRFLERSNEDLRQFAYAASHDLQEPLRMVTTYTQMLQRRYGSILGADGDKFIEYAVTGALRIENLLKGLREYWQVSELTDAEPEWTDCNAVLDRALQNVEAAIRESQAVVTRDPLPRVVAEETPLLQLFQNLIGNALKYRHPDRPPMIHVRAAQVMNEWVFSVADNGIGIDPKYARQVFGIFKRLNGYRYSGAGMGLAICQKIVERFGGRIWVESELEKGATFFFTVPADRRPLKSGEAQPIAPAPAAGSQR
ncbi:MAG TPA: PAS domain S-box protein [Bryobacteraceae bacterium]|nr:PAS domain S-box protein [Bryobacteraceae bacterium]